MHGKTVYAVTGSGTARPAARPARRSTSSAATPRRLRQGTSPADNTAIPGSAPLRGGCPAPGNCPTSDQLGLPVLLAAP